jgi:hypothetical protein
MHRDDEMKRVGSAERQKKRDVKASRPSVNILLPTHPVLPVGWRLELKNVPCG